MAIRRWRFRSAMLLAMVAGLSPVAPAADEPPRAKEKEKEKPKEKDSRAAARNKMVQQHLVARGIKDERVLDAFRTVPRHKFLPPDTQRMAYDDESIPIGEGQTITPPYDVAFMTEVLRYVTSHLTSVLGNILYRYAPPVPSGLPHLALEDVPYNEYVIEKGSMVFPNIWYIVGPYA